MYQSFYPETNKPTSISFNSLDNMAEYYLLRDWEEINTANQDEKLAFINNTTGDIVVIKEVENES